VPEQAVAGALAGASAHGAGPYLAVAFGVFVLGVVWLQQKFLAARDRSFCEALAAITAKHDRVMAELGAIQREAGEAYLRKTEALTTAMRESIGALVVGTSGHNRELLVAINAVHHQHLIERREDQRDTRVALEGSTAVLARVERALEHRARVNGAG
jgi:hypothetical protein